MTLRSQDPVLRVSFAVVVGWIVCAKAASQNLENIGKEKPMSVTGGISANQILYAASGIENRRAPYNYFLSGNINVNLYGWSIPLSFNISNQKFAFRQPFNNYSIHPSYKSVTMHAGYTAMTFSPYTVNGHTFLGGAVDVAPEGNWKISALAGRFLKATQFDSSAAQGIPVFERLGYGFKTSFANAGSAVDFILFRATDGVSSILPIPDSLSIFPEQNLVVSIGALKTISERFVIRAELAASALTRDTRAQKSENDHPLAKVKILYQPRLSSSYYKAFKGSFDYQQDLFTLGIAYERIDPQYKTLGAYYFNNDLENITVNLAASPLKGLMNITASGGTQRDNLDRSKISTMRRMVGAVNISYAPSQRLNLSASYSTFQSFTNIRSQFADINQLTPFDNIDTLNFTQISGDASTSATYIFGKSHERKQNITLNFNAQSTSDQQTKVDQKSGAQFYNLSASYALNITPQHLNVSLAINGVINESVGAASKTFGPTGAFTKSFMNKRLRTTLSCAYNSSYRSNTHISTVTNTRLNASLTVNRKHNMSLMIALVNRNNRGGTSAKSFTEYTATLGYNYSFGTK